MRTRADRHWLVSSSADRFGAATVVARATLSGVALHLSEMSNTRFIYEKYSGLNAREDHFERYYVDVG